MMAALVPAYTSLGRWTPEDEKWFCSHSVKAFQLFLDVYRNRKFVRDFFSVAPSVTIPAISQKEMCTVEFYRRGDGEFFLTYGAPSESTIFSLVPFPYLVISEKNFFKKLEESVMTMEQVRWIMDNLSENFFGWKDHVFSVIDTEKKLQLITYTEDFSAYGGRGLMAFRCPTDQILSRDWECFSDLIFIKHNI